MITGPGSSAARVELRQTAADINPYVAMAAALGAGLYGISQGLELPAETKGDATAAGAVGQPLPVTLDRATDLLRSSDVAKQILGEDFVDHYVRTRDWEVRQHRKSVSEWELQRYFELV